jgi:phage-related protein
MYGVFMYRSQAGDRPVQEFLDGLPEREGGKVLGAIDYLAREGPRLHRPHAAHLRGKLWELRVSWARMEYRILYFFLKGENIVLVHGFVKKTQAVPERELETAERRMKDFEDRIRTGEVSL